MTKPRFALRLLALLLAVGMAASACTSDSPAATNSDDQQGSTETDQPAGAGESTGSESAAEDEVNADEIEGGSELPVGAIGDPASLAAIEEVTCSFSEPIPLSVKPVCHQVTVPENWSNPDPDDQVILQVAVFKGDESEADPIIYFDGGPGGHTLDALSFTFDSLVKPLLSGRDFIVFDQRGVGVSEPPLACPEVTEVAIAQIKGEIASEDLAKVRLEAQESCSKRLLEAGVDLTQYNSISSANDVEAIRSLLDYNELNVVGISYGTRLAQSYMRMFPDSIRSVTLDSVFPTAANLWTNLNPSAVRAFDQLFEACEASTDCAEAHPDFRDRFFELVDQLNEDPAEVEIQNAFEGTTLDAVYNGDAVMGLVFSALYNRSQFSVVPDMVEQSLNGDYSTIALLGSVGLTNLAFVSTGQQLSVECNEEIPFESRDAYLEASKVDAPYDRFVEANDDQSLFDLCPTWPSGQAPEVENERLVSDIPTLVLAGQFDPITPPSGVQVVQEGLANSYSVLFPHEGHGLVPTECGAEIVASFINDPSTEPDSTCVASSPEPIWVPGDPSAVELIPFEESGPISIAGLRPDGWVVAGAGVFARQQTAADPTVIVIQPTNGQTEQVLIPLLKGQLGVDLLPTEPLEIDGVSWSTYQSPATSDQTVKVAISPAAKGAVVLLVARPEEFEALYDAIFVQIATAAEPG